MSEVVTSVRVSAETAALKDKDLMVALSHIFDAAKLDCYTTITEADNA